MEPISAALALANVVPALMRWFGAGDKSTAVAEKVVEIAKAVTGAPNAEAAVAAIQNEAAFAHQFRVAVLAAETELDRAYLADRQSARARDVELHKAGYVNRRADVMVFMDVVGLIACLVVLTLMRAELPTEAVTLLSVIAAIFGNCLRDAHQFEFGSSRGSKEKDLLLGSNAK